MGTTGENATIEPEDQKRVIAYTVEKVNHRVPVIAGTGTNNTEHVLANTRNACQVGADAILVVTPYYNKATQNGLIQHFTTVADASTVPMIVYNVPGRTGCNLLPKTLAKLAEHPNIVGVKEATGNMAQMVEIMHLCGDKLDVYSGEDALTVPMMAMGAAGTISVLSNVVPKQAVAMSDACLAGDYQTAAKLQCDLLPLIDALFSEVNPIPAKAAVSAKQAVAMSDACLAGDYQTAAKLQCDLLPLIDALFSEVNPIPAKAAVSAMGYGQEVLRLPLTPMEPATRAVLMEQLRRWGVSV